MKKNKSRLILTVFLFALTPYIFAKKLDNTLQLKEDLAIVWPLTQTVKIEYDLAKTQYEFFKTEKEKKAFMLEYEAFIKKNYFKKVLSLKLRQGKLLLLLIDREMGKTPFELLKENRSYKCAAFWQRFAKLTGANLKEKYNPEKYPLVEHELQLLQLAKSTQ